MYINNYRDAIMKCHTRTGKRRGNKVQGLSS